MGWEIFFCFGVIVLVFAGLVTKRPPDALLVGAVVLVSLAGIIKPEEAFAGFSNTGMLTVGALYIVAAALRETGALQSIGRRVFGRVKSERCALIRLAASVTPMSAFLNNTPVVAMFIPIISNWCKKMRIAPSRLLLPLSYLCILGGTCTLIGTSTNLVVNGLMQEAVKTNHGFSDTLRPMRLFELGYVGLPYAVLGISYLLLFGQRRLPSHRDIFDQYSDSSREYLANLVVEPACPLVSRTVEQAGLRQLPGLFLIEIVRGNQVMSPALPDQILQAGDILTFTGVVDTIVELKKIPGLDSPEEDQPDTHFSRQRHRMLCEAVISPTCPCLGKTIRDADFRATYNAVIVAVHRGGQRLQGKVGDIVLRPGDTLLLQTGPHFARANRNNPSFLLVRGVDDSRPVRREKAIVSFLLLFVLIGLMATGVVKIVVAAFLVAGLMIATRCISLSDARQSVDWQTLVTIAAAFGLGKALVNSGCVAHVAKFFVSLTGHFGPYAVLAGVYLMTTLFTEIVTNNAAAALIFPFAVAIAGQIGVGPRPFVMAVAFAASASFMTPIGYQTNLMVYGPGGYRLSDYVRIGLPLNLLLLICATVLIPVVWPFH
jgi:di/tricarboxylate transporter